MKSAVLTFFSYLPTDGADKKKSEVYKIQLSFKIDTGNYQLSKIYSLFIRKNLKMEEKNLFLVAEQLYKHSCLSVCLCVH